MKLRHISFFVFFLPLLSFEVFCIPPSYNNATFKDSANFRDVTFEDNAQFNSAIFGDNANFYQTTFGDDAQIKDTTFGSRAWFDLATFGDNASFNRTVFGDDSNFRGAIFGNDFQFRDSPFGDDTQFRDATFGNNAQFRRARFGDGALFIYTTFGDSSSFYYTIFGDDANFRDAIFGDDANFSDVTFGNDAQFRFARFGDHAQFINVTFGHDALFAHTVFGDDAEFINVTFGHDALFDRTKFGKNADFSFSKLQGVSFYGTDLTNINISNAVLHGCIEKKHSQEVCINSHKKLTNFRGAININHMRYEYSEHTNLPIGINEVRKDLRNSGYSREANEVIYFVEHGRLQEIFQDPKASYPQLIEAYLKLALFEMTTEWGINPAKALAILVYIIGFMGILYWIILLITWSYYRYKVTDTGIDLVFPKPNTATTEGQFFIEDEGFITASIFTHCGKQLNTAPPYGPDRKDAIWHFHRGLLKHAFWFSILSSFHLGWRDLNVGNWLLRMQPKPYTYRPHGALRTISGIQSLICIYLLVIWFLTTFGNLWG